MRDDRPRANPRSVPDRTPDGPAGSEPQHRRLVSDTFRLLLRFAAEQKGKRPCELDFSDLDAALIGAFLEHLEVVRNNSVRTRNNRLSAIHSLFAYSALRHPEHAGTIQRVLAIPIKLTDRKLVTYLNDDEVDALLGACDLGTWQATGPGAARPRRRSRARISELAALKRSDVTLGRGANLHVTGKGRKQRQVPSLKGRQVATSLAGRDRRRLRWPAAPDNHRQPYEPRRDRTPRHAPTSSERRELPFAAAKASHHPLAPAYLRHAAPAKGCQ